jgi:hypothetical protein
MELKMKKVLLAITGLLLSFGIAQTANAQAGSTALGLRLTPDGGGFTGKHFLDRNLAIEGQLNAGGVFGGEGKSFNAVGLLEYHIPLPDPSWRVFFGGGLHAGVWTHDYGYSNREGRYSRDSEPIFGIDGIGGVEYAFKTAPISLSADFKPAINLLSEVDFFPHNMFGVSARFHLR